MSQLFLVTQFAVCSLSTSFVADAIGNPYQRIVWWIATRPYTLWVIPTPRYAPTNASPKLGTCQVEVEQLELDLELELAAIAAHRIAPQTLFAPTCPCLAAHYIRLLPRGKHIQSRPVHLSLKLTKSLSAYSNLARMCQLPVINPIRTAGNSNHQFEDPSEPIYTDPSLFERSR